ncbi:MAG: sigma-54-dependent Fis family transcriptional regulator, partial [Mesorhizobium sp.]
MGRQSVVHADLVQASIATNDAAHSALVASWRRSLQLHRLDPAERKAPKRLTEAELMLARQRMEPLARAAEASLNRLYLAVGGVGCCVMLADRDGIPVERRGAVADDETFDEWGLWIGTVWSEDSEGTNGIGTCIADQRALTIHRDQHFFSRNTLLSCTTAPVYDHEGNLAAALDVSSCRSDLTEGFVQLIA